MNRSDTKNRMQNASLVQSFHFQFQFQFEFTPSNGISVADIDKDGLDEIIYTDIDGQIVAYNGNGTLVNGFPF